jgi:hypothetical protein
VCLLALCACKKDIDNEGAVRQGIMNYLAKRTDLVNMDVNIASVSFRRDEADATVHFQAKGSTAPGTGLDLNYVLERKNNEWVVKGKGAGNAAHVSGEGAGPMPQGQLPPGHPAMTPQSLPPGHPPLPAPSGADASGPRK